MYGVQQECSTYFHLPPRLFSLETSRPMYAAMPRLCHVSRVFLVNFFPAIERAPADMSWKVGFLAPFAWRALNARVCDSRRAGSRVGVV